MAFLLHFKGNIFKTAADVMKRCTTFVHTKSGYSEDLLKEIKELRNKDMPVKIKNPYTKEKPQCILCKFNIDPNFRNVRLLSQFVSSYTGRVYGRHITGLCKFKQKRVETEIKKAQISGLMGVYVKDANFLNDPDLYDPSKPFRVL